MNVSALTVGVGALIFAIVLMCIGAAFNYFGANPRILYIPAGGICLLILYFTHLYIVEQSAQTKGGPTPLGVTERPYVSASSMAFNTVRVAPGPIVIRWEIRNDGQTPATIVKANCTGWFETNQNPLPAKPQYAPIAHDLAGTLIPPHTVFLETFSSRTLTADDVSRINNGDLRFYFYGLIKYRDTAGTQRTKGFIGRYNPTNDPTTGMFMRMPEATAYEYGD